MAVWAFGVQYCGSRYSGWQAQKQTTHTVQNQVERALARVIGQETKVVCAGRTDAGVHALNQVIHLHTRVQRSERAWLLGANSVLPADIALQWALPVNDNFHARFSAISRSYCYWIDNTPLARPALQSGRATWVFQPLQQDLMQEAAVCLLGRHDFSAFRSSSCQAHSPVRTVHHLRVKRSGNTITIEIKANAFLHHMVRNIVGALLAVGQGKKPVQWVAEVLKTADRKQAGVTAPAAGLYFLQAYYPPEYAIPIKQHALSAVAAVNEPIVTAHANPVDRGC